MANFSNRLERVVNRRIVEKDMGFQGFDDTPFVDALINKSEIIGGGLRLEEPIASTTVDRSQFFVSGFGQNSTWTPGVNDIANNFAMATWDWVNLFTPTVIDEVEAAKAGGNTAVLNYIDNQLALPTRDHKEKVARNLIHGTAASNDWQGILSAISDDGTSNYGGLPRKAYPALIGNVIDGSDVAGTTYELVADIPATSFVSSEGSNVIVSTGGASAFSDLNAAINTSAEVRGKDIVLSNGGTDPQEIRTVVDMTEVGNDIQIYLNRPMNSAVNWTVATLRSKLYSSQRYGAASKFAIEKLDSGYQRSRGKVDCVLTDQWGYGHTMEATRAHEYAVTESERKRLGFSGFHKAMKYQGADMFIDDHIPSGTFIGTDFKYWRFAWLKGFSQMAFRRSDSILNIFPGGSLAVATSGYVLVNVAAFGSAHINCMFKLENVSG